MKDHQLHRLQAFAPFALALASLLFIGWAAWRLAHYPEAGVSWSSRTGIVGAIVPRGPASNRLQTGDRILSVDGSPVPLARPLSHHQPGESVSFLIERAGETRPVVVPLVRPSPSEILARLQPVLVGLIFWGLGTVILAFSRSESQGPLFFLLCQASSAALASGALSGFGPLWAARLFGLLLWWLGPLAVHFHLYFPAPASPPDSRRFATLLYALAALNTLLDLALPLTWVSERDLLNTARLFWLAAGLLGVLLLLMQAYRRAASPQTQRQVGVIAVGAALALMPFVSLSLLPNAVLRQPLLPYETSFLFLLAIPLAYGYAILRYRLMHLDRYVSRGAASALVVSLLAGLYLALNAALLRLLPSDLWQSPLVNLALVLILAAAFAPLRHRLEIIVNRLFYGGWLDYRTAVQQVSQALDQAEDGFAWTERISQAIRTAMQLDCACLLLPDRNEGLTTAGFACSSCSVHRHGALHVERHGPIGRYFQGKPGMVGADSLRKALEGERLSEAEAQLLACKRARVWVPLPGRDQTFGLLLLGAKRGGEMFDADDRLVLEVMAREASLALQNTQLLAELRQRVWETEQLHQRIVHAREAERKRVARELHDQIIQALIGVNYHLSELRRQREVDRDGAPARLQEEVRCILNDVRRICGDLRPPVLDSLGLVPAVRSRLRELEREGALRVRLQVEGDEEQDLPEEVALCLYRVLQEALLNVQKHAAARQVKVGLRLDPDEVLLSVEDDGQGFTVPPRLGLLTHEGRFGLIGLRERLEIVQGKLKVTSRPGQGTLLEARVPLTQPTQAHIESIPFG